MNVTLICENCKLIFNSNKRKQKFCTTCYQQLYDRGLIEVAKPPPTELSELQREVLIGTLLGDGHLSKPKKETHNSSLIIRRQFLDKDYLKWQKGIFENFCRSELDVGKTSLHKKTNKKYDQISMHTRAAQVFSNYRKIWYPNSEKVVPRNFELTQLMIAVWLADDGSIGYGRNKQTLKITFSTHGFEIEDVEYLISLLNYRYNETFNLQFDTDKNYKKRYPVIIGANKASRTLLEDIDSCFPLKRKADLWRNEECNFYKNKPTAKVSGLEFKERRSAQLFEFIKNNNQFMYKDIAQALNWYVNRFDKKEPSVSSMRQYLKQYIDFGLISKETVYINTANNLIFKVNVNLIKDYETNLFNLNKLKIKEKENLIYIPKNSIIENHD